MYEFGDRLSVCHFAFLRFAFASLAYLFKCLFVQLTFPALLHCGLALIGFSYVSLAHHVTCWATSAW